MEMLKLITHILFLLFGFICGAVFINDQSFKAAFENEVTNGVKSLDLITHSEELTGDAKSKHYKRHNEELIDRAIRFEAALQEFYKPEMIKRRILILFNSFKNGFRDRNYTSKLEKIIAYRKSNPVILYSDHDNWCYTQEILNTEYKSTDLEKIKKVLRNNGVTETESRLKMCESK